MSGTKVKKGIYPIMIGAVLLLNTAAWISPSFCDAYITYVFPVWLNTYGRVTGSVPFSVGEWMLAAGVLLVAVALLLLPIGGYCLLRRKPFSHIRGFYVFFGKILMWVCLVMTLNCSILYHATPFSVTYFGEKAGEYSLEECIRVYNLVAAECNRLSREVDRDEEGRPAFRERTGTVEELSETDRRRSREAWLGEEGIRCMQRLGERYSGLAGWYPKPKPMFFSDLMCQMYMCGYYFPFSLEANYNRVMEEINQPAAVCHELAHLRGYIYEDEANFIAYLACQETEDPLFLYSGYLSVLPYLAKDLNRAAGQEPVLYREAIEAEPPVQLLEQVLEDDVFVNEREWERIHRSSPLDTETVDQVSDTFTDTVLKLNGVSDGMVSYSRVVELLMLYYRRGTE